MNKKEIYRYIYAGHKDHEFDFLIISNGEKCEADGRMDLSKKCKSCPKLHYKIMVIRPSENGVYKLFETIDKCCAKSTFLCKKLEQVL